MVVSTLAKGLWLCGEWCGFIIYCIKEIMYIRNTTHKFSINATKKSWPHISLNFYLQNAGKTLGSRENKAAALGWLTDWVGCWHRDIHFVSLLWETKYAEMIFSKLADNLFIFAVGRKPVIVIKMLQIFSQYPYCCKVFLAIIQPCISRLISYNTCCGLKLIKSTPWNESFLTI